MNFNSEDGGNAASETLVRNHQTKRRNKPQNQEFYFNLKVYL